LIPPVSIQEEYTHSLYQQQVDPLICRRPEQKLDPEFSISNWGLTTSAVEKPVPNITAENAPASPEGESRGRAKVAEEKNQEIRDLF